MNIAIDYDNTFTADVMMWTHVVNEFICAGHTVMCVTNRALPSDTLDAVMENLGIDVIYAGDRFKRDAVWEDAAMVIDIWIDDIPGTIGEAVTLP